MGCKYCDIASGKRNAAKIYEDPNIIAILSDEPASIGHIEVFPRRHVPILEQMLPAENCILFMTANRISTVLFEALKIEGTNIIMNNGLGQEQPHVSVHVISRQSEDAISTEWAPRQIPDDQMSKIEQIMRAELEEKKPVAEKTNIAPIHNAVAGSVAEQNKEVAEVKTESVEKHEESYLVKQLRRMP
jgi:histidine triad (HIT) family protein